MITHSAKTRKKIFQTKTLNRFSFIQNRKTFTQEYIFPILSQRMCFSLSSVNLFLPAFSQSSGFFHGPNTPAWVNAHTHLRVLCSRAAHASICTQGPKICVPWTKQWACYNIATGFKLYIISMSLNWKIQVHSCPSMTHHFQIILI